MRKRIEKKQRPFNNATAGKGSAAARLPLEILSIDTPRIDHLRFLETLESIRKPLSRNTVQSMEDKLNFLLAFTGLEQTSTRRTKVWLEQANVAVSRLKKAFGNTMPLEARFLFLPLLRNHTDDLQRIGNIIEALEDIILKSTSRFLLLTKRRHRRGSRYLATFLMPAIAEIWTDLTGEPPRSSRNRGQFEAFADKILESMRQDQLKTHVRGNIRKLVANRNRRKNSARRTG